ncbi:hypothetical protein MXD81_62430 [Microbacteriaceae bacterium K1510]|nr:hypothetical protein [Microbacteriaceae bacterium K1510]
MIKRAISIVRAHWHHRPETGRRTNVLNCVSLLAFVGVLAYAFTGAPAIAQDYPRRPVTFVVGYSAGGTGDVVARIIAQKLSVSLGQSVVVENRPGASGGIAAQFVGRSEPDGYTILVGQSAEIAINPNWLKGLTYNPEKDLQPIALGVVVPLGLVVPGKAPYSTLKDLVATAGNTKQALTFASAGTGTPGQFAGELLRVRTGTNLLHVPYKGAGPALNDIIGGHVDMYFSGLPAAMGHVRSGQIKLLAVSSAARSSSAPDAPTVAEVTGIAPFDITLWAGFFAPHGTPADIVERLNREINNVLAQSDVKERLITEGADVSSMSVERFTAFVKDERQKYQQIIKETGIKSE